MHSFIKQAVIVAWKSQERTVIKWTMDSPVKRPICYALSSTIGRSALLRSIQIGYLPKSDSTGTLKGRPMSTPWAIFLCMVIARTYHRWRIRWVKKKKLAFDRAWWKTLWNICVSEISAMCVILWKISVILTRAPEMFCIPGTDKNISSKCQMRTSIHSMK